MVFKILLAIYIIGGTYVFVSLMSPKESIKFVNKDKEIELKGLKKILGALLISSLWLFAIKRRDKNDNS